MHDCIGQNTLELIPLRQSLEASLENFTFFLEKGPRMPRSTLVFVAPERGFYSPRWCFRRHRYPWRSSLSDTIRARLRWCMLWYCKRICRMSFGLSGDLLPSDEPTRETIPLLSCRVQSTVSASCASSIRSHIVPSSLTCLKRTTSLPLRVFPISAHRTT